MMVRREVGGGAGMIPRTRKIVRKLKAAAAAWADAIAGVALGG